MIEPRPLPGGATAILEPIAGTRTLSIGFWFPFGSRHELPGERGYTHFIEHMLFKGTPSRDAAEIARTIDRLGGYLNAFTERESVCFYCTLPGEFASTAIEVLIDMIFSSNLPGAEFEKEKTVIVNEILSAEDDPEDLSYDKFLKAIWPGNSISNKIAGEAGEVSSIDRDGLERYYRERFVPGRLLVCASGAFRPEEMESLLSRGIRTAIRRGADRDLQPIPQPDPPAYKRIQGYEKADVKQIQLFCGHPFPLSGSVKDYYAFTVFNCAFGESMSSRLFQNIREARGFCYSIYSFFAFAQDMGLWCVNGSTTTALFDDLREAVIGEIRAVCERGLADKEIEDATLHLRGSHIVAAEDIEHRMKRLARQHFYNGKVLDVDEGLSELEGAGPEYVNELAMRRIKVEELSLYAYGAVRPGKRTRGLERIKSRWN